MLAGSRGGYCQRCGQYFSERRIRAHMLEWHHVSLFVRWTHFDERRGKSVAAFGTVHDRRNDSDKRP